MKKEKWLKWEPLEGIPKRLCLEELKDNREGLTICLKGNTNSAILIVHFESYFSYRVTDEGDLLKTLHEMENQEILGKSSLFTVENSLYSQWFYAQNYGMHDNTELTHYRIATPDEVIDVLYLKEPNPTVMWS